MSSGTFSRSRSGVVGDRSGGVVEAVYIILIIGQHDVVGQPMPRLVSGFISSDNVSVDHGDGKHGGGLFGEVGAADDGQCGHARDGGRGERGSGEDVVASEGDIEECRRVEGGQELRNELGL